MLGLIGGQWLQWGRDVIVAEIATDVRAQSWVSALQWGRDVIVAEMRRTRLRRSITSLLQWGRDVIVAEIGVQHEQ